jgi:hypothetical protein
VHKLFAHIGKIFRKVDVSPIDSGGISKTLIFIVWGINALVFLGEDLITGHQYLYSSCNGNYSATCTITKKISTADLYTESINLVKPASFIVISSYNYEIPSYDVRTIIHDRSPPLEILL